MTAAVAKALAALGAFLLLLCAVGMVAAIWTVGPDSARVAGTSAVVGFIGLVLVVLSTFPEDF